MPVKQTLRMATAFGVLAIAAATSQAALNQNDIVVGTGAGFKSTSLSTETHPTVQWQMYYNAATGTWSDGPGPGGTEPSAAYGGSNGSWDVQYLEDMIFDNTDGYYHNANGNLLATNYGNSYSGFTIYALETQGGAYNGGNSDAATVDISTGVSAGLWSIKNVTRHNLTASSNTNAYTVTKGAMTAYLNDTERGVGLSVSPLNNRVAWLGVDSGTIAVQDYNPGTTPGSITVTGGVGTLAGASISGTRLAANGDQNGNVGFYNAVAPGSSGVTTWLNNNVVLASSGADGRLVMWNIANVQGGNDNGAFAGVTSTHAGGGATDFNPNLDSSWKTVYTLPSAANQATSIYYNAAIDPTHIYAAVTESGTYAGHLYRLNFDGTTGAITLDAQLALPTGADALEPRSIAMDSNGNLYMANYSDTNKGLNDVVAVLMDATDSASWTLANLMTVAGPTLTSDGKSFYSGYPHLDVAATTLDSRLVGDYNNDGFLNSDDYTTWATNYGWQGYYNQADGNADGVINSDDYTIWATYYAQSIGQSLAQVEDTFTAIPEPTSLGLLAAVTAMGGLRRRRMA